MSENPDFETFVAQHRDAVVRALTLALADRPRAEDAAQDAFAKAFRQWRRVAVMDRPVAWVYVVALNGARKTLRRELAAPAPDVLGSAPDLAGLVANGVSVREALGVLAPRQRVAVVLRYLADLQVGEVAAAMDVSVGTAKATLHTALARLRVEMAPDESTGASTMLVASLVSQTLESHEPLEPHESHESHEPLEPHESHESHESHEPREPNVWPQPKAGLTGRSESFDDHEHRRPA